MQNQSLMVEMEEEINVVITGQRGIQTFESRCEMSHLKFILEEMGGEKYRSIASHTHPDQGLNLQLGYFP